MRKIRAGIVGGAGYTGGELARLLLNHPQVTLGFVYSRSNEGKPLHAVHHDLLGETELRFSGIGEMDADVIFLCMGHGESGKFLSDHPVPAGVKIIDLSNDFRLQSAVAPRGRKFVYGLPEMNREAIRLASDIANPGCFATAIQLGLLPLAKAGLLTETYTTGITGSTGAGQGFSATSHFSWRANNIQAYKTLSHQHLAEIEQSLKQSGAEAPVINFVPWRGDFTRGIFISSTLDCDEPLPALVELYTGFFHGAAFTFLSQ
ncbi:MAG TPA: N-acetyl-gamma-glutamyl-phosphate reductase, partial [Chitinophagaceae bacterium]